MNLSHFGALAAFSILAAAVFAITTKDTPKEQIQYGVLVFLAFLAVGVGIGWVMYLLAL